MFRKYVVPSLLFSLLRIAGLGVIFFLLMNLGKIQCLLNK